MLGFFCVADNPRLSNSLIQDLLDIGELYDHIKSKEKVLEIDSVMYENTII